MKRPVALVCYICGREFGTASLAIHLKACEKKWENEQNLLPPKQRRPCPRPPRGFEELQSKGQITKEDIHKFNAKSFDAFVEEALVECQYCGRRFNEKSLIPHQKACMKSPMIRKPYVNKGPLGKFSEQEQPISTGAKYQLPPQDEGPQGNLVGCRRCGRKFNADRVGKHQKVCKGQRVQVGQRKEQEKPMKPMKPQQFGKEKKAKWKIQHEQLQNAMKMMRQMRAVQARGGKISDLPPPPPSNYDHYVECRHCGRKYAADVAERHIPKCANIINKPGGIKPSRIQEKYIAGTGSGSKNWGGSDQWGGGSAIGSKPNMMVSKPTNSNSYVKPPTNSNPFGDPYANKGNYGNYGYGNGSGMGGGQQQGPSSKNFKSSPFEKTPSSNNKGAIGMGKGMPAKEDKVSYLKPNLHSKTNPSNYW